MKSGSHLPIVALALLLSACALPQTTTRPLDDLPSAWQALTRADDQQSAWTQLQDAELQTLQERALIANRDLRLAALRWQQARRQWELQEQRIQPIVEVSAGRTRTLEPATQVEDAFALSATASYELDLWNRLAAASSAAGADADAVRTDIDAARAGLLATVAQQYWSLAAIAAKRPVLDERIRNADEIVNIMRLRVAEGKELPIEVDKAASALQSLRSEQAAMDADARLGRHALAILLDLPLPGPELAAPHLPKEAAPHWRLTTPAAALQQRPDVQRARLAVDAALSRLQVARAERYPRLSFTANAGSGGARARDLIDQPLLSLVANLTVPLIDWQRLEMRQDNARDDLEIAALGLRDTVQKALRDIEAWRIERARLDAERAAATMRWRDVAEAARLAALRYELGVIARVDWLNARNAVLSAQQEQVELRGRTWLNHAAMAKALGRTDWTTNADNALHEQNPEPGMRSSA